MDKQLEQYEELKQKLKEALQERKIQEENWDKIQQEIFDKETEYWTDTQSSKFGNIIKGFESFGKTNNINNAPPIDNENRIFSLSSALFVRQIQDLKNNDENEDE